MNTNHISLLTGALLCLSIESALAETTPTTADPVPNSPTNESTLPAIGGSSNLSQQAGVIQNNGFGSYGYPNCSGTCFYSNIRTVTNAAGNGTSIEASIGIVWQLSSPEHTQVQANKAKIDTEREQLTAQTDLALTEKLAEAIENNKLERVNAIAIILAKRLGYPNYRQYLAEVYNISNIRSATTQIDVPINY